MSTRDVYDLIVIGGGPSGMMAAGRAAERGLKVLLIEKNRELGKKLSITGGGRCNIFNAEEDTRALLANYEEASEFLFSPFSQHGMKDSWSFFEKNGLPIVVEARKRAFPKSQSAPDVTQTMKRYVTENNAELKTRTKVKKFLIEDETIVGVETSNGIFMGKKFVLATGGSSYEATGSSGDGLNWLKDLGHTVHSPNPNIVPLTVDEYWVKKLSGTTLSFMKITFGTNLTKKEGKFSKVGKILFTHFGLSGPLILNSSREVKKLLEHGPVPTTIDMYPDTDTGSLRKRILSVFEKNKNKTLKNVLKEFVAEGMEEAVAMILGPDVSLKKVHSISKEERDEISNLIKAMPLTVVGTMGMDWAVISDGGVDLKEVDTRTMQSKLHENLYFTGDVLNISRPSGGYSLQLCWTTGWVAGSHA